MDNASEGPKAVILVEGPSDCAAVETLGRRLGRDLAGEGVVVVPMGGATNARQFLERFGPHGLDVRVRGLCDVGEVRHFARALERTGFATAISARDLARLGFHVCDEDLEDELIRAVGVPEVERVLADQGELGSFRVMQRQPAQRERAHEQQLRRFIACGSGRKTRYARLLAEALELSRVPHPLAALLSAA